VVTNQSIIQRGIATWETVKNINQLIFKHYKDFGLIFDFMLVCPHSPDSNCNCRKPKTGNIEMFEDYRKIDLRRSFVVGDQETDILFGKKLGTRTILLHKNSPNINYFADYLCETLNEALSIVYNTSCG
jgi:histidinol-phosphate phosphatase family protein